MALPNPCCPQGHLYDEANTRLTARGHRIFRACCRARAKAHPLRAEKRKAWRLRNPDKVREYKRVQRLKWVAADPERVNKHNRRRHARIKNLPAEKYDIKNVIDRDGICCLYCGEDTDASTRSVEHLEPLSWPGSAGDVLLNVTIAHRRCNTSRGNRTHPYAELKRAELLETA